MTGDPIRAVGHPADRPDRSRPSGHRKLIAGRAPGGHPAWCPVATHHRYGPPVAQPLGVGMFERHEVEDLPMPQGYKRSIAAWYSNLDQLAAR